MAPATSAASSGNFATLVARLYSIWTLDALVEIGYAISGDFIARPQLYLSDDIPDAIVDLRMAWGTDARFPNTAQRLAMMTPIFGRSDGLAPDVSTGTAPFHVARKKLVDACIAFSERAVDTGIAMLKERVRSALVPLRAHFDALAEQGHAGKSLRLTASLQMGPMSNTAVSILLAPDVAKVFSVSAADAQWPFQSTDPNGAKLIESVGTQLPLAQDYKLGYTRFILLQRVAQEGERALIRVISANPDSDDDLLALISQVYTWGTSLRDYQQAT
jgi:hypothetical protein